MSRFWAGLSRLSRPPAGFLWSHLPPVRYGRLPPVPRQVVVTHAWSHLPMPPPLAWQKHVQADGT